MQRVKFEREDSRRISPYAQFSLSCLYRKEAEPDSGSLSSIIRFPVLTYDMAGTGAVCEEGVS